MILEIADDLCHGCQMSEYGHYRDKAWEDKYMHMHRPEQKEKDGDGWYTTEIKVPGGLDYYFIISKNGNPQTADYGPISYDDYPEIWVVIQDELVGKNGNDWCKYYNYNPDLEN